MPSKTVPTKAVCRPLNSIGLPHYTEPLLSSWTASLFSPDIGFPAPPKIPTQVLNNLKITGGLASAALPKELKGRRNVVNVGMKKNQARFRSGKMQRSVVSILLSTRTWDSYAFP
jgi:PAB-dependent poly(A)-specific ribonuclease subunit 2